MVKLEIPVLLWWRLVRQLKRRGGGRRESGAFLLGKNGSSKVCHFICYDDLDESTLNTGIVVFRGRGFVRLWEFCKQRGMKVLADVHTHSGSWTGQSEADRTNPMIGQPEHVAIILPHFAKRRMQALNGAGIYEYLGSHVWRTWHAKSGRVRITLL